MGLVDTKRNIAETKIRIASTEMILANTKMVMADTQLTHFTEQTLARAELGKGGGCSTKRQLSWLE